MWRTWLNTGLSTGLAAMLAAALFAGGVKKNPLDPKESGNNVVDLVGQLIVDPEAVKAELGMTPDFPLLLVRVTVKPKLENTVRVDADDFTLLSNKDGQRSGALSATQIAGKASLILRQTQAGGAVASGRRPTFGGGLGGIGMGEPSGIGNTAGSTRVEATVDDGSKDKTPENPLVQVLKQKALPQGDTADKVTGLLYFMLDGKHKPKDLDLIYKAPGGRLILDFEY